MSRLATKLGIGLLSSPTSTGNLAESLANDAGLIEVTVACRHLPSVDEGEP